jgi:cobalt/nickel transport protein
MKFRYSLEIITIIAILAFCAVFLFTSPTTGNFGFTGSDTAGSNLIAQISGKPVEDFQPLVPQWKPPGTEIESCLFALQAAVGGVMVGGVFGYWIGQKKKA